jgi:hypothetical protein
MGARTSRRQTTQVANQSREHWSWSLCKAATIGRGYLTERETPAFSTVSRPSLCLRVFVALCQKTRSARPASFVQFQQPTHSSQKTSEFRPAFRLKLQLVPEGNCGSNPLPCPPNVSASQSGGHSGKHSSTRKSSHFRLTYSSTTPAREKTRQAITEYTVASNH